MAQHHNSNDLEYRIIKPLVKKPLILSNITESSLNYMRIESLNKDLPKDRQPSRKPTLPFPVYRQCGLEEEHKVKTCVQPLHEIGALTDNGEILSWQHLLTKSRKYFADACAKFIVFDTCVEPYRDICFDSDKALFQYDAALKVLDFICRDGYRDLMTQFDCFTMTLTRAEMLQCQAEMVADTRKVPQMSDIYTRNTAACGAMRNYIDCVRYPVRYECGYRAWQLIKELIIRPTESLLPGCQLNAGMSNFSVHFLIMYSLVFVLF